MSARLIVIGGFAGAGKSTLARSLGQALGLPFYEIDLVGKAIAGSKYFKGENPKGVAYDVFWAYARNQLENGCSLIFDQNMGQVWQWTKIKEICDSIAGVEQLTFILDCPYELCVERANARTNHPGLGGLRTGTITSSSGTISMRMSFRGRFASMRPDRRNRCLTT